MLHQQTIEFPHTHSGGMMKKFAEQKTTKEIDLKISNRDFISPLAAVLLAFLLPLSCEEDGALGLIKELCSPSSSYTGKRKKSYPPMRWSASQNTR